jgi:hypothetical protein
MLGKNHTKLKEDRRNNPKSDLDYEDKLKMLVAAAGANHLMSKLGQADLEIMADWGKGLKFDRTHFLARQH